MDQHQQNSNELLTWGGSSGDQRSPECTGEAEGWVFESGTCCVVICSWRSQAKVGVFAIGELGAGVWRVGESKVSLERALATTEGPETGDGLS